MRAPEGIPDLLVKGLGFKGFWGSGCRALGFRVGLACEDASRVWPEVCLADLNFAIVIATMLIMAIIMVYQDTGYVWLP